jgi:hypothetical protein
LLTEIIVEINIALGIDVDAELHSVDTLINRRVTLRRVWPVPSKYQGVIVLADDKLVKLYGNAALVDFELPARAVLRVGEHGLHYWES